MRAEKSPETVALENGKQVKRATTSDFKNICLLLLLFALQAIPGGFIQAMPLLLQSKGVTYVDQAVFHIVHFPYSVKLLWAPLVDSVYSKRIGKRKTWIVSSQYLLGIFFFIFSLNINKWIGHNPEHINIGMLTIFLFFINTFRATQDIALDGWSLTILKKENMGYSGHISLMGTRIGHNLSFVLFTVLNSTDFCNDWIRRKPKEYPIVSTADFLKFWAVVFVVVTTMLLLFKKENDPVCYAEDYDETEKCPKFSLAESYRVLVDMFAIKPLRTLCLALLVCRAGMGPLHGLTPLKLVDAGVTRAQLVLVSLPLVPVLAALPFVLKRYIVSEKSMIGFNFVLCVWGLVTACTGSFVYFTPKMQQADGEFPFYYFVLLTVVDAIEKITVYVSAVTLQALFYQVSDRNFGGTYITLLNMLMNTGKEWTVNLSLWIVEPLTWKKCSLVQPSCDDDVVVATSVCTTFIDGYYILLGLGLAGTLVWLTCGGTRIMSRLQKVDASKWRITYRIEKRATKDKLDFAGELNDRSTIKNKS